MQLEMNWYLVLEKEPIECYDPVYVDGELTEKKYYFETTKDGARIYPIGEVVPIIKEDKAIGMVHIRECSHRLNARNFTFTVVAYEEILSFKEDDPVADHYTELYRIYKKRQEAADHGGKFKTEDYVNALERRDFEKMLAQAEEYGAEHNIVEDEAK